MATRQVVKTGDALPVAWGLIEVAAGRGAHVNVACSESLYSVTGPAEVMAIGSGSRERGDSVSSRAMENSLHSVA